MYENKLALYAKNQRTVNSAREVEAEALTLGANKLQYCHDNWESKEVKKLLAEALKFNQRLWTIFQASLGSENNRLPENLKLELLKLSAFMDNQIFSIMAFPAREKLLPIIKINLDLATGLKNKVFIKPSAIPPGTHCAPSLEIRV
ncbi:MAG: flagellar biosynthesis regulator FlaF [Smithella sp.]